MNYTNQIINKFGSDYKIKGDDMCFPCPYHHGKSYGSFKVSVSKGVYKCFNCSASGHVMEGVKSTTPYIPAPKIEGPIKEFKQVKPSNDGYFAFKKYITTRQIDINLDNFNLRNKFSYYYDKGIHYVGLLVSDTARYTYYLNSDYTKKNKIWKKGSQATPFYFNHKDFKECKNLYIFEGFEDCLAFIELYGCDFESSKFCIIFGVGNSKKVDFSDLNITYKFCIDNDDAGVGMVRGALTDNRGITFRILPPLDKNIKDFNEELKAKIEELKIEEQPKVEELKIEEPKIEEPKIMKEEPKIMKEEPKIMKEEPKIMKEEPKIEEVNQDKELTLQQVNQAYNVMQSKNKEDIKRIFNFDDAGYVNALFAISYMNEYMNEDNINKYIQSANMKEIILLKQIARC